MFKFDAFIIETVATLQKYLQICKIIHLWYYLMINKGR